MQSGGAASTWLSVASVLFARILPIDSMVSATQGYKVIPDMSMAVNRLLQFTIAMIAIHFELVGFHGISFLAIIPSHGMWESLSCDRGETLPRKPRKTYYILPAISTFFCHTNGVWRATSPP